jgi:hypothetical protein
MPIEDVPTLGCVSDCGLKKQNIAVTGAGHIHLVRRWLAHAWMKHRKDKMRRGACVNEEGRGGVPAAWIHASKLREAAPRWRGRREDGGASLATPSRHESDRPFSPWIQSP